jgi:predicted Ser/Thr protein kinase
LFGIIFKNLILTYRKLFQNLHQPEQKTPKLLTGISVLNKLGSGAFGDVFLGNWNGVKVALKMVQEKGKIEDLKMEAKILKLIHIEKGVYF